MVSSPIAVLSLMSVLLGVAFASNLDCAAEFQRFRGCLKNKVDADVQQIKWNEVQQCFEKHGCTKPDENDAGASARGPGGLETIDEDQVMQCAQKQLDSDKSVMMGCVQQDHSWLKEIPTLDGYENKGLQIIITSKSVLKLCNNDHSKRDLVKKCMAEKKATNIDQMRHQMCEANTNCQKTDLKPECNKESEDLAKHICQCVKSKAGDEPTIDKMTPCLTNNQKQPGQLSRDENAQVKALMDSHSCDDDTPQQYFDSMCKDDEEFKPKKTFNNH